MSRLLILILIGLAVFAAVAALMVRLMPSPMAGSDYMVIGAVATLAALMVLLVVILSTSMKGTRLFTKRPKRRD